MNDKHYLILNYIRQCGDEAQLHFLPDHVKAAFSPDNTPASIQGTLLALRLWGFIVPSTPTSYKITNKGCKILMRYEGSSEGQPMQLLYSKSMPAKPKYNLKWKRWLGNAFRMLRQKGITVK